MKTIKIKKMVMGKIVLLLVFGVIVYFAGCKKDVAVPQNNVSGNNSSPNSTPVNLISNGSFESGGQFTYHLWVPNDTTLIKPSKNVPAMGGLWSLQLLPGSTQGTTSWIGYIDYYITGISGNNSYTLNVYSNNSNSDYPGIVTIGKLSGKQIIQGKSDTLNNLNVWQAHTVQHIMSTNAFDTIIVRLSAGTLGPVGPNCYVLFDLIELKK
ncbi:MAG: hypothetical protein Fur0023_05810 [Bacteroidia bacterium]